MSDDLDKLARPGEIRIDHLANVLSYLLEGRKMGWQKTFTLSRRAKGCHLVTNEVVSNIRDGLQDVEVHDPVPIESHRI